MTKKETELKLELLEQKIKVLELGIKALKDRTQQDIKPYYQPYWPTWYHPQYVPADITYDPNRVTCASDGTVAQPVNNTHTNPLTR